MELGWLLKYPWNKLKVGNHPELTITVNGYVTDVFSVSKFLLFFTLTEDGKSGGNVKNSESILVVVKHRDWTGFIPSEISRFHKTLEGLRNNSYHPKITIKGFLERHPYGDKYQGSLHAIVISLQAPSDAENEIFPSGSLGYMVSEILAGVFPDGDEKDTFFGGVRRLILEYVGVENPNPSIAVPPMSLPTSSVPPMSRPSSSSVPPLSHLSRKITSKRPSSVSISKPSPGTIHIPTGYVALESVVKSEACRRFKEWAESGGEDNISLGVFANKEERKRLHLVMRQYFPNIHTRTLQGSREIIALGKRRQKKTKPPKRKAQDASNSKSRGHLFYKFLEKTFKLTRVPRPGCVIDVAGGQGQLAIEFWKRGIDAVVIDPRQIQGNLHNRRTGLRVRRSQVSRLIGAKDILPIHHIQSLFDAKLLENPTFRKLWDRATVVVGMHPDEATDDIVRLSLKHGKGFAVVPCCVFWKTRKRYLASGDIVKTYFQYCQWLSELHPDIRKQHLGFKGRDCVLYRLPPSECKLCE